MPREIERMIKDGGDNAIIYTADEYAGVSKKDKELQALKDQYSKK